MLIHFHYKHVIVREIISFCLIVINIFLAFLTLNDRLNLPETTSYFEPPITSQQNRQLLDTLRDFDLQLRTHNISYMIGGGTLVGAYRHHGIVPWDDDVDVFVFPKDRNRLRIALRDALPARMKHYRLDEGDMGSPAWKFYSTMNTKWFIQHRFRWPYVDILFLPLMNTTHFYYDEFAPKPRRVDKVIPLTYRPFADMMLPCPCDSSYVLDYINLDDCQNRAFSHIVGFSMPLWRQYRIPCDRLKMHYPFVDRRIETLKNGLRISHETLMLGCEVIHKKVLKLPKCG